LAIAVLLLVACEKNTRNFLFGVPSKTEQLARNWMIAQVTDNGNDVTFDYDRYSLNFSEKGEVNLLANFKVRRSSYEYNTIGTWFFLNNHKKLLLDFENNNADGVYHILKLQEEEIWLKKEGEPLELHFVSQ
jgi:hypothetical protein